MEPLKLIMPQAARRSSFAEVDSGGPDDPAFSVSDATEDWRVPRTAEEVAEWVSRGAVRLSPDSPSQRAAKTYVVQPGDTLTKIAREHYGKDDPATVHLVFAANRGALADPDHVTIGSELILPGLDNALSPPGTAEHGPLWTTRAGSTASEIPAVHTVKPGDSLSRIATAYYGSSAKQVIEAIYRANRDVLSSPDHLDVGRNIKLPVVEVQNLHAAGLRSRGLAAEVAETGDGRKVESTAALNPAGHGGPGQDRKGLEGIDWRWYELRKGDVYSTVAARVLGTSKRWRELADLNEDIFPDASRIRSGVRIRVPIDRKDVTAASRAVNGDA